jgi:hypothetical protein
MKKASFEAMIYDWYSVFIETAASTSLPGTDSPGAFELKQSGSRV